MSDRRFCNRRSSNSRHIRHRFGEFEQRDVVVGTVEVELGMTDDFRNVRLLRKAVIFGPVQVQVAGPDGRWVVPEGGAKI